MTLGMRPPIDSLHGAGGRQLADVRFHCIQIDAQSRGIQVVDRCADERHSEKLHKAGPKNVVNSYNTSPTRQRGSAVPGIGKMSTILSWRTSFSTSVLHAAEALLRGENIIDSRLAAVLEEPAAL